MSKNKLNNLSLIVPLTIFCIAFLAWFISALAEGQPPISTRYKVQWTDNTKNTYETALYIDNLTTQRPAWDLNNHLYRIDISGHIGAQSPGKLIFQTYIVQPNQLPEEGYRLGTYYLPLSPWAPNQQFSIKLRTWTPALHPNQKPTWPEITHVKITWPHHISQPVWLTLPQRPHKQSSTASLKLELVIPEQDNPPTHLHYFLDHYTTWNPPDNIAYNYKIVSGDTLWGLAKQDWPKLWANNSYIGNPHWIYPGDPLNLEY